jgi:hypothetical protein
MKTALIQHPNTSFAFKRGINAAEREKEALFSKTSFMLLPSSSPKKFACTTFEC